MPRQHPHPSRRMPIVPNHQHPRPRWQQQRQRQRQYCCLHWVVVVFMLSCCCCCCCCSSHAAIVAANQEPVPLPPPPPLIPRRIYERTWHSSSSSSSNNNNKNDENRFLSTSSSSFRIVVQGHTTPLFFCPQSSPPSSSKCTADNLEAEQDVLWQNLIQACPTATLLASNIKLVNTLTVQIPATCVVSQQQQQQSTTTATTAATTATTANVFTTTTTTTSSPAMLPQDATPQDRRQQQQQQRQAWMQHLSVRLGASKVYQSQDDWYTPTDLRASAEYLGAFLATQQYCTKGDGVRVAILDSGLDYSHEALSGNGTSAAYLEAYGMNPDDVRNTVRGPAFPTLRVVDGYDFLGDTIRATDALGNEFAQNVRPDPDPIDGSLGHGTGVAHALLGIAGRAELVALKVCVVAGGCPEFAILNAMEYALDPNGDGDPSDHVDIINLSLGRPYTHPYYSAVSKAIEDAFQLGVLTVVAAGNNGNRPGVIFEAASSPNALAVGATGVAESNYEGGMADYSSRGPSASTTFQIKPDLVSPGGPFDLAAAGTGNVYHKGIEGTSYAAPIVAGAAALIKQRCPECSPFAIKAILMNNASRNVRYLTVDPSKLAPISWAGAGELQVYKAVTADFWAFNVVDLQPSISLGVLNVDKDMVISKQIRVQLLDDENSPQPVSMQASFQFRDTNLASAMKVEFSPETFELNNSCGSFIDVGVTFSIVAANVPTNHLTSAGQASIDPTLSLDPNELDGWIVFTTNQATPKDISLPMHAIVRRAAHVQVENTVLPALAASGETKVRLGLENKGAGTAQIDTYELVHTSPDDPEVAYGVNVPPVDFRYIGYRAVQVGSRNCEYMVEFVFHTWETIASSVTAFFEAQIDRDGNGSVDVIISNRGPQQHKTNYTECRVFHVGQSQWSCAGFAPDHTRWSANTVIRACSNDLGIDQATTNTMQVRFRAISFGRNFNVTERDTPFAPITFPNPVLSGPSFDLEPGSKWDEIVVTGPGQTSTGQESKGLLLITNGYRSQSSTGASTRETEAIAITQQGTQVLSEATSDEISFPRANSVTGPLCSTWRTTSGLVCNPFDNNALGSVTDFEEIFGAPLQPGANAPPVNGETCFESVTPLDDLSTRFPTTAPTFVPTTSPTVSPTATPTTSPIFSPTGSPTALPTRMPMHSPTSSPTREPSETDPEDLPTENPIPSPVSPGPPVEGDPPGPRPPGGAIAQGQPPDNINTDGQVITDSSGTWAMGSRTAFPIFLSPLVLLFM